MTNLHENWLPLRGYEGTYEISDHGNVAVLREGIRVLRKLNSATSYLSFSCRKRPEDKSQRVLYVHQQVAFHFIGERPKGQVVRHKDGNRYNNAARNLEYGTPGENVADSVRHQTYRGERNGRSLFTEAGVKAVLLLIKKGVSLSEIARECGCSVSAIWQIKEGLKWAFVTEEDS